MEEWKPGAGPPKTGDTMMSGGAAVRAERGGGRGNGGEFHET